MYQGREKLKSKEASRDRYLAPKSKKHDTFLQRNQIAEANVLQKRAIDNS